jgi:hypothetical protein
MVPGPWEWAGASSVHGRAQECFHPHETVSRESTLVYEGAWRPAPGSRGSPHRTRLDHYAWSDGTTEVADGDTGNRGLEPMARLRSSTRGWLLWPARLRLRCSAPQSCLTRAESVRRSRRAVVRAIDAVRAVLADDRNPRAQPLVPARVFILSRPPRQKQHSAQVRLQASSLWPGSSQSRRRRPGPPVVRGSLTVHTAGRGPTGQTADS